MRGLEWPTDQAVSRETSVGSNLDTVQCTDGFSAY